MSINLTNWPYFAFILILLILAGTGEFLHLIPAGTFGSLLLVAIGLIAPSPMLHPSNNMDATTQANTTATQANTAAIQMQTGSTTPPPTHS